jgi:hypothetical protein
MLQQFSTLPRYGNNLMAERENKICYMSTMESHSARKNKKTKKQKKKKNPKLSVSCKRMDLPRDPHSEHNKPARERNVYILSHMERQPNKIKSANERK